MLTSILHAEHHQLARFVLVRQASLAAQTSRRDTMARVSFFLALICGAAAAPSNFRGTGRNGTASTSAEKSLLGASWAHSGCCSGCGTSFCSPQSGTCYDQKGKNYYLECRSGGNNNGNSNSNCCNSCSGSAFCSPNSGNCYSFKGKDYYLECLAPSRTSYTYAGRIGCRLESSYRLSALMVGSSSECRSACDNTPGCIVYNFNDARSPCGTFGDCQLFTSCVREESECFAQYVADAN